MDIASKRKRDARRWSALRQPGTYWVTEHLVGDLGAASGRFGRDCDFRQICRKQAMFGNARLKIEDSLKQDVQRDCLVDPFCRTVLQNV